MPMKISNSGFFDRVDQGLKNDFMWNAMVSAQERLKNKKQDAEEELGIGRNGVI
jgi:L-lactate dehydrogenase complex protein LldF